LEREEADLTPGLKDVAIEESKHEIKMRFFIVQDHGGPDNLCIGFGSVEHSVSFK
jgi:hypothetical protein